MQQQQQAYFFEMYRSGLRAAAEMMEENARYARQASEASTAGDLMSLQARLTATHFEKTMDHWTRMWRMVGETQATLIGQAQNHVRETYSPPHAANMVPNHERKERKSA
jgi:hypothetical protein